MLQEIIFDSILYFSNPKIASYLGNKGTWDECRFRKTHHSYFLFQNQPYDLSWSYPSFTFVLFILIFTLKGWSTKSQNFFTRWAFNHTTHTRTHSNIHTIHDFEQWCFWTCQRFWSKEKDRKCFCIMMNGSVVSTPCAIYCLHNYYLSVRS